jgi:Bacterial Ig-like domain
MAVNSYLVLGVNPSNEETGVPTDKTIEISFAKHMSESSLSTDNLTLKDEDGVNVEYDMQYISDEMKATLDPKQRLTGGKKYVLTVTGGPAGVRTITSDYLPLNKSYSFTTANDAKLSTPRDLQTATEASFVALSWNIPADYPVGSTITYEAMITDNTSGAVTTIWPLQGDINKTQALGISVPKKLSDSSYTAYVRATVEGLESDWTTTTFTIATAPVETPDEDTPVTEEPVVPPIETPEFEDIFDFEVVETYPEQGSVNITPEKVVILFSSDVNMATVTSNTFYVVEKPHKEKLSVLDYVLEYGPAKQITAVIDEPTMPNVISLTAEFEPDKEYTVIVRGEVASADGVKLGFNQHTSFISKYTRLFGDEEQIRADMGAAGVTVSDRILYKHMNAISIYAYQVNSGTTNFLATDYEDGKAPYYMHQYVRFKVGYDLLLSAQMATNASSNSSTDPTVGSGAIKNITLGDLTVGYDTSSGGTSSSSTSGPSASLLATLIPEFKTKIKVWEDMMHGHNNRGYAKPVTVTRGETGAAYPDFMTRTEFTELGQ